MKYSRYPVADYRYPKRGIFSTAELLSVASAGYSDEKGKYYLDSFFDYSDIYETYEKGKKIYGYLEDDDDEDDSNM